MVGNCISSHDYNAIIAAIIVGIMLVLIVVAGIILFWFIYNRKKRLGMLYDKLKPS